MKSLRMKTWEETNGWEGNPEIDRILDSERALPEQIQDFETQMVLIGSDVISLYPNLVVNQVVERVKEAVVESSLKWEGIDYLECVRYLALNWSQEECSRSPLRRVLPVRRGKRGSRPGIKGPGPRGGTRGCQEQWIFPDVFPPLLHLWWENLPPRRGGAHWPTWHLCHS